MVINLYFTVERFGFRSIWMKYFTQDGWLTVQNVVEAIKKNPAYYCGSCTLPINDEEDSIQCDSCLVWYHFQCVNLKQRPKCAVWFCRSCYHSIPAQYYIHTQLRTAYSNTFDPFSLCMLYKTSCYIFQYSMYYIIKQKHVIK